MRLTKVNIEEISAVILKRLKSNELVTVNATDDKVLHRIMEIINGDMAAEEALDREVKKVLEANESEFREGKMDYAKMFNKIKHKLAEERDIVL